MRPVLICIVSLLSAVLLTSCGTAKLARKDMSEFDSGRKAIVRTDNSPLVINVLLAEKPVVRIRAVDGADVENKVFKLNDQIAVDVGEHEIEFGCVDRAGYNEQDFEETITMDLKPYHMYMVDCWFESGFNIKEKRVK